MQRNDIGPFVERRLAGRDAVTVDCGACAGRLTRPDKNVHTEGATNARDHAADTSVAMNAERLAAQRVADTNLPLAGLQRRHLLWDVAHRSEDQAEGQLRRSVRRRISMLARRNDNAQPRARVDIDMREHTTLRD